MNRILLRALLGITVFPALSAVAADAGSQSPNIVVIVSDDCGYNEFSMQGATLFPTPRIDSLAANGVRFSNGYVSGAVCSPTRAGLLTGRYQQRFGHEFNIPPVYSEVNGLPSTETTLADVLKAAGYRTIALGKWHLGYAPPFHPLSRGFDDYYGFLQGARSYWPLTNATRLNQLLRDREPVKPETFDYMTDELGRAAADYIAKNRDRPFLMYLAFNATHGPLQALESDLAGLDDDVVKRRKLRAMTLALDRAVGMVLDELKQQSLFDNTLIVFVNDNGGPAGHDNAPLRGRKGQTWEGGVRVPFAMQWPAVLPKDRIYSAPVISLDIFPTAMAAAGVEQTSGKPLDGVNLIPFLTGKETGRPHQTLFWKNGNAWAVRDGDLKLVMGDQNAATPELFDLDRDIGERSNLAAERPADVERLRRMYEGWKRDFPRPTWGRKAAAGSIDSEADVGRPRRTFQRYAESRSDSILIPGR
jgi:arylsulfatase A-like enzyme